MTITLQKLLDAGLPALTCDGLDATWSRSLTPEEWITVFDIFHPITTRNKNAKLAAQTIPNWASWAQIDWTTYRDANIGSSQINAIANLADAKAMLLKMSTVIDAQAKMIIAMRDYTGIED